MKMGKSQEGHVPVKEGRFRCRRRHKMISKHGPPDISLVITDKQHMSCSFGHMKILTKVAGTCCGIIHRMLVLLNILSKISLYQMFLAEDCIGAV